MPLVWYANSFLDSSLWVERYLVFRHSGSAQGQAVVGTEHVNLLWVDTHRHMISRFHMGSLLLWQDNAQRLAGRLERNDRDVAEGLEQMNRQVDRHGLGFGQLQVRRPNANDG